MKFHGSRKVRDRETRSPARETHALPRKCTQIIGHVWIFRRRRFNIADFDIDSLYAEPFEFENQTSNVERPIPNRLMDLEPEISNSKNRTGVIDVIAHDPKTGEAVLVMNEPNEWEDSDEQLLSLQERFNAYVSFLLDGEMESGHPELAGKPARIEVRCTHMPDARAIELLGLIHDQLAFQSIKLEVVVRNDPRGKESASGC
jgi:Family of unknown function (DUF6572)